MYTTWRFFSTEHRRLKGTVTEEFFLVIFLSCTDVPTTLIELFLIFQILCYVYFLKLVSTIIYQNLLNIGNKQFRRKRKNEQAFYNSYSGKKNSPHRTKRFRNSCETVPLRYSLLKFKRVRVVIRETIFLHFYWKASRHYLSVIIF